MSKVIADIKVLNVWQGKNEDGELYEVVVNPDYYECNGTPVDECGDDMEYLRTEIEE